MTDARPSSSQANAGKSCTCAGADSRHFAECKRVATVLERRYPDSRVIDEGQLRREERFHGRPLASASLSHDQRRSQSLHRPDLVIWPPVGEAGLPVAVEVELTLKAAKYLSRICRAWNRCPLVDCVLYVASAEVERTLRRILASLHAGEHIFVIPLDSIQKGAPPCPTPTSTASSSSGG